MHFYYYYQICPTSRRTNAVVGKIYIIIKSRAHTNFMINVIAIIYHCCMNLCMKVLKLIKKSLISSFEVK